MSSHQINSMDGVPVPVELKSLKIKKIIKNKFAISTDEKLWELRQDTWELVEIENVHDVGYCKSQSVIVSSNGIYQRKNKLENFQKLDDLVLKSVSCGNDFVFGTDYEGNLFGWGRKLFLGLYEDEIQLKPMKIQQFEDHHCLQGKASPKMFDKKV